MAPKRRANKVVGSVVKTKVVQETVELIVADDDDAAGQQGPEALAVAAPTADVSGPTVVRVVEVTTPDGGGDSNTGGSNAKQVEVTTPDGGGDNTTGSIAKQPTAKRGRGRREEVTPAPAPAPEESVPVPKSQETQDPNEEQTEEENDAGKTQKKKPKQQRQQDEAEEQQPETPRVASERKASATATAKKTKTRPQQRRGGGDAGKKKQKPKARRRLGQTSAGGEAGMGGIGGYKRYVWRVLKQVHPELGVSGHAMQVLDMMMADMFERLAGEAARLSMATGKITLTSREVQSAVRLVLPGELGKHAISEGTKAISKYMNYA